MTNPLTAAVLVLQYKDPFRSGEKYMGRAAQKIALGLMARHNPTLVDDLHDQNSVMPLTISDLFQSDAHHHWLRMTATRPDAVTLVNETANDLNGRYDGWRIVHGLTSLHDWAGQTTADQLRRDHWTPQRRLKLQFETLTAIKRKGLYRPFPEPDLVFKSLYERHQQLITIDLPYLPDRELFDLEAYGVA